MFLYPVFMRSISSGVGGSPAAARAGLAEEAATATRAVVMAEPARERRSRREAAAAWMAVEEGERVDGRYTLEAVNAVTSDAIKAARKGPMAMI